MKNFFLLILLFSSALVSAQDIINFSLTNVRDGKEVALSSFKSPVVVVFTSHECPFDNYYKERLKELINSYSGRVSFVLINSNTEPEESVEQMAIHLQDLPVPYLADKAQTAMGNFGARKSPEVFLLTGGSGKFSVVYKGAIDDNPQVARDVRQHFLKDALDKTLAGQKPSTAMQRAAGCTIRGK